MHHFDGAACQAEGHGPEAAPACPVDQVVDAGDGVFDFITDGHSPGAGEELVDSVEAGELYCLLCKIYGRFARAGKG